ncbi:MAG: shikimate kinase [Candidatus Schekmanbacteria bacterium]|nr:shikimate kinase [Candidatus Schekmanbacteria bacterium]
MKNVILTGFMATGKSAVGRVLAQRLGYKFIDTDNLIAEQAKKSIAQIFQDEGEAHFRCLETELLRQLENAQGLVIATGGGMILPEENFRRLKKLGPVICLTASPEVILARAKRGQTKRPLLNTPDPLEKITQLLEKRKPFYRLADFTVDTSGNNPAEAADSIFTYLKGA